MSVTNKILATIFKIVLFGLMLYFLYLQLHSKNVSFNEFYLLANNLHKSNYIFGIIAVLLMPINWLLESFKWQKLVHAVQTKFTFKNALQGVLTGVFFGFITPNRVGEFGGRLFKIEKGNKSNALNLSFVGGLAQFVVTFLVGVSCSLVFILAYFKIDAGLVYLLLALIYLSTIYFYFNFKKIIKFIFGLKKLREFSKKYIFNFDLSFSFLRFVLFITLLRYCVYVLQYVLILYFLGIDLSVVFLFKTIGSMLLLQTIIPSFALVDVGIRGNILLFLLADFIDNQLIVLVAVLLVWILNLVIPAIVGYINFVNLKWIRNEEFNNNNIINNHQ